MHYTSFIVEEIEFKTSLESMERSLGYLQYKLMAYIHSSQIYNMTIYRMIQIDDIYQTQVNYYAKDKNSI